MAEVRQALLEDTGAISALFRSRIQIWQRLDARGHVETVDYNALTLYERWLHGGPWMSIEMGAIFLNHLLMGGGIPLVAVEGDQVVGYAEVYHGVEPEPYGNHLYLAHLVVREPGVEDALLESVAARAKAVKAKQILISRVGEDPLSQAVANKYKLKTLACLRRYGMPARMGQVFYRAVESLDADPKRIQGWSMPVGRLTSSRHEWETMWTRLWDTMPRMQARKRNRLHFSAAGQEALICFEQSLYDPRSADVYCWSPRGLSIQLVMAIRDWGHREGYRTLTMVIDEGIVNLLGAEVEGDGYRLEACAVALG